MPKSMYLPRTVLAAVVFSAQFFSLDAVQGQGMAARVQAVRFWSFGDVTRVAIETQGEYKFSFDQVEHPSRIYFDLRGLRPPASNHRGSQTYPVNDRRVKQIRVAEVSPGRTRIVFDLEGPAEVVSSQLVNPDRLIIEIRPKGTSLPALSASRTAPAPPRAVDRPLTTSRVTTVQTEDGIVVQQVYTPPKPIVPPPAVIMAAPGSDSSPIASTPVATAPVIAAAPRTLAAPAVPTPSTGVAAPAKKDSAGDRSLVRVFGLKMAKVVIDAGHGGHDTGTIGPGGLMEKDLVLDVALRLGALISKQLGAQVVYTRSDDTFIPLEQRTKIANQEKADLFISVHANSSPEPSATGVETYFFNLTSDRTGVDLATRENATSASSISDLNDLLHRAVLQAKLEESREFAQDVQASLWASSVKMNDRSRDRGVRQAPFMVLIGATMPSILAEIGFVSNPHDEKSLRRSDQRERIAEALCRGIVQYAGTLSHLQLARSGSE